MRHVEDSTSIERTSNIAPPSVEEKHLVRKMDMRLLPVLVMLYVMGFLDRVNIGNARLYSLEADLGLTGDDYQLCVSVLFATYVVFEMPANIFLKKVGPRNFIPLASVSWGLVSMCTGFVQNKTQLIVVRLLLGACEAGYFPGICLYLGFWYCRRELGVRVFYLFTASAVAGSFGGLLAYAIGHMDGIANYHAWRWLMILEGIPTICLGVAAYFLLDNEPASARFLTAEEKQLALSRIERDSAGLSAAEQSEGLNWSQVMVGLKDWRIWVFSIAQVGVTVMLYGYSTFLPTIIEALGYSGVQTQLLTIPCYACGAVSYAITAYWSDRLGQRGVFTVGGCLVASAGYAILLGTSHDGAGVQYAGCLIVAIGLYVSVGVPISWMPNNLPSAYKRAAGNGLMFMMANCAGVISSYIYLTQDAPEYTMGHAVVLGFVLLSGILFAIMSAVLWRENRKRDRGERDYRLQGKSDEELAALADDHPWYRYLY
ncbi:hypothetical protein ASPZODRAFT_158726 [Penicilliopsis zonata CBS 506.65]|uniref:Major facilitator superfamily (MFS) profile domain-containing protein n=1 Tax=Penicilliopsis zonata CBS 506.65 TaxID=1073090 RepID=A0A1L9SL51_9EURO|nr:hypothetical protein ASPZODRAFT_158726 [Penicilliopsis zonata CBS 506.65]OJJ47853.1 hypothetical protein ASPZODRAFT_158726 [Penicilliopsis zonata CBS 506.65]